MQFLMLILPVDNNGYYILYYVFSLYHKRKIFAVQIVVYVSCFPFVLCSMDMIVAMLA